MLSVIEGVDTDAVPRTYEEACRNLIASYLTEDADMEAVYLFPDAEGRVVQIIGITSDTMQTDDVMVFKLGRTREFPFQSAIGLVTPEEWRGVEEGRLSLPRGWGLETAERYERPDAV